MRCYYCGEYIKPSEKTLQAGFGKELHESCVDAYRQYLRRVVETMNREFKKGETQ